MIWAGFIVLSLIVMTPFAAAQTRIRLRGRRDATLALYRRPAGGVEYLAPGAAGR